MKKNRALFMWGAVTALVVAGAVFDYQWEKYQTEKQLESAKVFAVESSQVAAVELVLENPFTLHFDGVSSMTNKVRFAKRGPDWWIENPVEERADQDAVNGFIEGLTQERATKVEIPAGAQGEAVEWSSFGLDQPKGSIRIYDQTGQSSNLLVGTRKNFQGEAYLRRNEENQVWVGTSSWFSRIEQALIDFRDKRVFRHSAANVKFVEIVRENKSLRFERQDAKWSLVEHPSWQLDQNKVREVVGTLFGGLITDFKREGKIKPEDLKEFSLVRPVARLRIGADGLNEDWTAALGEVRSNVSYMHVTQPSLIVTYDSGEAAKLIELDPRALRDRRTPFQFDKANVASLELSSPLGSLKAERNGDSWNVKENPAKTALRPESLSALVDQIQKLEALSYVDEAKKKLTVPEIDRTTLVLRAASGDSLYELSLGSRESQNLSGRNVMVVAGTSSVSPLGFYVDEQKVKELRLPAILDGTWTATHPETSPPPGPETGAFQ